LDRVGEALHVHVAIVLSDRGLDLENLVASDLARIAALSGRRAASLVIPAAVTEMNSVLFHSFLRDKVPIKALQQLERSFRSTFGLNKDPSSSAPMASGKYFFPLMEKEGKRQSLMLQVFRSRRGHQVDLSRKGVDNHAYIMLSPHLKPVLNVIFQRNSWPH
jgi:hypothetical protein